MSRGIPLSHCLARIAAIIGLLIAGAAPFIIEYPVVAAQEGPALVVDDAETANPELLEVELGDPAGFGVSGQVLEIQPGYTISAVAAGLGDPRFMAFDDAGNLLVGTGRQAVVYRFPFADDQLGESEVLISGLQQPASVEFISTDEGE